MGAEPYSRYILGNLPWYSVLIVSGMVLAVILASREEKRLGLPRDTAVDLALYAIPFGVIGARVYYVFFAWDTFAANPLSVLYIWQGGLAIYGGVLGGLAGIWTLSRRKKLPFLLLLDTAIPGVSLAQSIGRWGNYFNMEAYGAPILRDAFKFFPLAVRIDGQWHQATFFYESLWDFAVFWVLWLLRKRKRRQGDLFCWYVLFYGAGRLVIEGLRTDSLMSLGGTLRVSQLLSALSCAAVCVLFLVRAARAGAIRRGTAAFLGAAAGMLALSVCLQPPIRASIVISACCLAIGCFAYTRS